MLQIEVFSEDGSRDILSDYESPDGTGQIKKLVPVDNNLLRLCVRFPGGEPFPLLLVGETAIEEYSRAALKEAVARGLCSDEEAKDGSGHTLRFSGTGESLKFALKDSE